MAKGYWIVFYRSVSNPAAVAQYAKPAEAAVLAGGGRFLARGTAVKVFEAGIRERSIVIEFDSSAKAIEVYCEFPISVRFEAPRRYGRARGALPRRCFLNS